MYCKSPLNQARISNNGDIFPCCHIEKSEESLIGRNFVLDKEKANTMANTLSENNPLCIKCVEAESNGIESERIRRNRSSLELERIDIIPSNKCNYACLYCNSIRSTAWIKKEGGTYLASDSSKLLDIIDNNGAITNIRFSGGEPLICDVFYEMIYKIRKDINVEITTNGSTLIYKNNNIIEILNQFENSELHISVDGVGQDFNDLRVGGNWEEVSRNINELVHKYRGKLGFLVTVTNKNITSIDKILTYLEENKYDRIILSLNVLSYPDVHRVDLPEVNKILLISKYEQLADSARVRKHTYEQIIEIIKGQA